MPNPFVQDFAAGSVICTPDASAGFGNFLAAGLVEKRPRVNRRPGRRGRAGPDRARASRRRAGATSRVRPSTLAAGSSSEHSVRVGGLLRNGLDDVPVLDDLAVL